MLEPFVQYQEQLILDRKFVQYQEQLILDRKF